MYSIPAHRCYAEKTIKKSRFIACADKVADRDATKSFLQSIQTEFPDARHYCWAYRLGAPKSATAVAASDDGEPSGTAGKPILNVLSHKEIGDVMVIVVRYFGGVKLGASGLIRAYAGSAQAVIEKLPLQVQIDYETLRLDISFDQEQFLRHWLRNQGGLIVSLWYLETVQCVVEVPVTSSSDFFQICNAKGWKVSTGGTQDARQTDAL